MVSELPPVVCSRVRAALVQWRGVDKNTKVGALKKSIMAPASPVGSCSISIETSDGQGIVGKFALEEFDNVGFKARTQHDWVTYFLRVSKRDDNPTLVNLAHIWEKWLKKNAPVVDNPKPDEAGASGSSSSHGQRAVQAPSGGPSGGRIEACDARPLIGR